MKRKHSCLGSSSCESSERKCFQAECFSKLFKRCQQQFNISEVSLQTDISGKVASYKFKWSKQEEECFKSQPSKKCVWTLSLGRPMPNRLRLKSLQEDSV